MTARRKPTSAGPPGAPLFTLEQVAAFFGIRKRTIQAWRASGHLRVLRLTGGTVRVEQAEIDRLLREARK